MDKLEFDVRLANVERRLAFLTALILAVLLMFGISALFLVRSRPQMMPSPSTVMMTHPAAVELHAAAPTHPVPPSPPMDMSEGSIGHRAFQLREIWELKRKSLLTDAEFEAKKTQILARLFRSSNLGPELEQLAELRRTTILTEPEYQTLRTKLLEASK